MKLIKRIALTAIITLSVFGIIVYTSCKKDNCKSVACLNGGSCAGGICACDSGLGGAECQTVYRLLYANTYIGNGTNDTGHNYLNYTLVFTAPSDSMYANMNLVVNDSSNHAFGTFAITLSNYTSAGSNFTIAPTAGTAPDSATYTGTGTVSATQASLNLTLTYPDSTKRFVSFNNFNKKS